MSLLKSSLSERAEAYVRIATLEGALRVGPLDEETADLRREILAEQHKLAKAVMPAAFIREEARRGRTDRRGR